MYLSRRVAELETAGVPFALAIVVSRRAPVSSHVGDRAVVFADGRMEGFVGGSCSRDIVRRHAMEAIRTATPRVLQISPDAGHAGPERHDDEHVFVPMNCASEGAAEIYIEPHLPARRLIVIGFTPVAQALARLASALEYDVVRAVDDGEKDELADVAVQAVTMSGLQALLSRMTETERARTSAVVASLGHYDETALDAVLDCGLGFVGLVASRKRAATVFAVLAQQGHGAERMATIRNPVGLDIGARTPGDVAVSILAEIVSSAAAIAEPPPERAIALDPICGMDVEMDEARHVFEFDGRAYYFCGAGCRTAFAADPARALASAGNV